MARPVKEGLDYFPMDLSFDDNVRLIQAEYGLEALGVLIKLWQKAYAKSYFIEWDSDIQLLFCRDNYIEEEQFEKILKACFNRKIFDENLFKKHGILTSRGIQKRYLRACKDSRRKEFGVKKEFLLQKPELTRVNATLIPVNTEETQVNTEFSTQREREKEKERESIFALPNVDFVVMTEEQYENLIYKWGKQNTDSLIQKIDNYIGSTGKKYKSHYHVVSSWALRDGIRPVDHKAAEEIKAQLKKSDEEIKADLARKFPEGKLSNKEILSMLPKHLKGTFKQTLEGQA